MKIEFVKHWFDDDIDNDMWFELGVSLQKTYYRGTKWLLGIAFGFWSIHIRWGGK